MSVEFIEVMVRQTIPVECMAAIDRWLLTRIFKTQVRGDRLCFDAFWTYNDFEDELSSDDELITALAASRDICPELCAAVEREIYESGRIMFGAVNYEKIFQSILQRHPKVLHHVSIEERDCNTHWLHNHETFTLITVDAIESIRTVQTYDNERRTYGKIQIIRRPYDPASPYIWTSVGITVSEDRNDHDAQQGQNSQL